MQLETNVRCWHLADIASAPTNVRYQGQSGHRNSEHSGLLFDPTRTLGRGVMGQLFVLSHSLLPRKVLGFRHR